MTSDTSVKRAKKKEKLQSISSIVAQKSRRLFAAICAIQIVVMLLVVIFLTFRDAVKRAHFLSESSDKSIGFMLSTGDLFQVRTTSASFVNNETVGVGIVDETGKVIFSKERGSQFEILHNQAIIRFDGIDLFLRTEHAIDFNNYRFGTLILLNRLRVYDWLLMCGVFLGLIVVFFYFQNRFQASVSREIGSHIINLGTFFDFAETQEDLDSYYNSRFRSRFEEVENLADKIKIMLTRILQTSTLEKQAAVGRIISQVTHDIRAPLGVFERFIDGSKNDGEGQQTLRNTLKRLYAMVEALRHSEAEYLIKRTITSLDFQHGFSSLQSKGESRKVSLDVPSEPISNLSLDGPKFERAWVNLASNALDFARTEIRVEVEKSGSELVLRVIDDGPGVSDEFLPKLFQRGATHGKADGTGLGLAYVRQIMRGHGGDVTYRRENNLTIFECRLPNSVLLDKEQNVENSVIFEMKLEQKLVRPVAICLDPGSLSRSILAKLTSHKSEEFLFIQEREEAVIVVGNSDEVMFEVHEHDEQEYFSVAPMKGDEAAIMRVLAKKFNLTAEGADSV